MTNSLWISSTVRILIFSFKSTCMLCAAIAVISPTSVVRMIPSTFYFYLEPEFSHWSLNLSWKLCLRLVGGVVTYVGIIPGSNLGVAVFCLNVLIIIFCLHSTLITFRHLCSTSVLTVSSSHIPKIYREIQLLFLRYNEIHKNLVIPLIISCMMISFCCAAYPLISKRVHLDSFVAFLLANVWLTSIVILRTCFTIPLAVHVTSSEVTSGKGLSQALKLHHNNTVAPSNKLTPSGWSIKLMRKYWESFPTVKIHFSANFFERRTPLLILDFCITITVNLILLRD